MEKVYSNSDLAKMIKKLNRNLEVIFNKLNDLENKMQEIDQDIFSMKIAIEEIKTEL